MKRIVTRFGTAVAFGSILAAVAAPSALANFVYWPNLGGTTIGRAALDGSGANNNFLQTTTNPATDGPQAVAVDSKFIYWAHGDSSTAAIGRANLDGTGINPSFIPHSTGLNSPLGVAVTSTHIYWVDTSTNTIGRANIDGSQPNNSFIPLPGQSPCGLAADNNFLYYSAYGGASDAVGRVPINGGTPNNTFIPVPAGKDCGVTVDSAHVYWVDGVGPSIIGRANIDGTGINHSFISGITAYGVAVTPQFIFWGGGFTTHSVGRSNLDGTSPSDNFLVAGAGDAATPYLLAASPSNQFTVGPPRLNKKKGTAQVDVTVKGPGVLVADAASLGTQAVVSKKKKGPTVKRATVTATGAGTFPLTIKAGGNALKKLKRKGKAGLSVGITFTPKGVAGVPSEQNTPVRLKKKKKRR